MDFQFTFSQLPVPLTVFTYLLNDNLTCALCSLIILKFKQKCPTFQNQYSNKGKNIKKQILGLVLF